METIKLKNKDINIAVEESLQLLLSKQFKDGHWAFELETDITITAEYILLNHSADYFSRFHDTDTNQYSDPHYSLTSSARRFYQIQNF